MDRDAIIQQLGVFATNLKQIIDILPSLSCAKSEGTVCSSSCDKCKLLSTRNDVINAVVDLNVMVAPKSTTLISADEVSAYFVGSLILAPRFHRGSICWDFAVITTMSIERDAACNTVMQETPVSVLWAYPQNTYELHASAITFSSQQLRPPTEAVQLFTSQQQALQRIQPGDEVLFHSLGTQSAYSGIYARATIVRVQADTVTISPTRTTSSAQQQSAPVSVSLSLIRLPPLPACNDRMVSSAARASSKSDAERDGFGAGYRSEDGNSGGSDSEHEGITSLPSYLQQHIAKCSSRSSLQDGGLYSSGGGVGTGAGASKVPVGLWEQHTKGVGSKIMQRMGYTKQAGEGLGKSGQGIAAPIEGLAKALPPGLSLDFIRELTRLPQSAEPALALRGQEIKMDIVARFNAAQQTPGNGAAGRKPKNKAVHKSAATGILTKPFYSEDFFGFLNKVNEPQPGGKAGNVAAGDTGKGFVPNSVIASQQRAAAHKNTKPSKFF